jgi:hypothetical protein
MVHPTVVLAVMYLLSAVVLFILWRRWQNFRAAVVLPPLPEPVDTSLSGRIEAMVRSTPGRVSARSVFRALRRSGFSDPCSARSVQCLLDRLVTNHHTVRRTRPCQGTARARRRGTVYSARVANPITLLR